MFDALVLAGGAGRRLAGADKAGLLVGGRTLLDRVLDALPAGAGVVVVGAERPTARRVTWARESPPGGGPAAALAAGLPRVQSELVAVLAADLPFLSADLLLRLSRSAAAGHGAVLLDPEGREQWLVGVWRTAALRGLALEPGARLGAALATLEPERVTAPPGAAGPWLDCDTAADLEVARALA